MTGDTRANAERTGERAMRRLQKNTAFRLHLLIYLLVNGFLVVTWAGSGSVAHWLLLPVLGWSVFPATHAWVTFRAARVS